MMLSFRLSVHKFDGSPAFFFCISIRDVGLHPYLSIFGQACNARFLLCMNTLVVGTLHCPVRLQVSTISTMSLSTRHVSTIKHNESIRGT